MLDGSGVKAMPGSISTPNSGLLYKNKKIHIAKLDYGVLVLGFYLYRAQSASKNDVHFKRR